MLEPGKPRWIRTIEAARLIHIQTGSLIKADSLTNIQAGPLSKTAPLIRVPAGRLMKMTPLVHIQAGSLIKADRLTHIQAGPLIKADHLIYIQAAPLSQIQADLLNPKAPLVVEVTMWMVTLFTLLLQGITLQVLLIAQVISLIQFNHPKSLSSGVVAFDKGCNVSLLVSRKGSLEGTTVHGSNNFTNVVACPLTTRSHVLRHGQLSETDCWAYE